MRRRVAIVGVGLIGGSLGLALRRRGWHVVGVGRNAARLRRARALECTDEFSTDWKTGAAGCSVVVLAVPVDRIVEAARRLLPHLPPGCLVMDVGSVKGAIVTELDGLFNRLGGPYFVGAHPMAGSEKTGAANARADLFRGAPCVVSPGPRAPKAAVRRAEEFWRSVGARVLRLSPDRHDRRVALVSHLPHLVADAMVLSLAGSDGAARLAAGSFRDMTRVAGADPEQWSAIFRMNAAPLAQAASRLQARFRELMRKNYPPSELKKVKSLRMKMEKLSSLNKEKR